MSAMSLMVKASREIFNVWLDQNSHISERIQELAKEDNLKFVGKVAYFNNNGNETKLGLPLKTKFTNKEAEGFLGIGLIDYKDEITNGKLRWFMNRNLFVKSIDMFGSENIPEAEELTREDYLLLTELTNEYIISIKDISKKSVPVTQEKLKDIEILADKLDRLCAESVEKEIQAEMFTYDR